MKYITTIIIALVAVLGISCDALRSVSSNSISSQGSPYEVIIVCNQAEWDGALGDSLRTMLRAEIPYLVQSESYFTTYRVTHQGYDNLIPKHRNIFIVSVEPTFTEPQIVIEYDVNATPQIIMALQAPTQSSAVEYLYENREAVMQVLERTERDRDVAYAQKFSIPSIEKLLLEKFDMEMHIPQGYVLRNEEQDFIWVSYEYPTASQGMLIYSYPAEGNSTLKWQGLLEARNRFAALVPGPSANSFMSTFMEVEPLHRRLRINGRIWAEMRGLWEVTGDYMGGPFVSYSTFDKRTDRIIVIDCYVYSPKLGKRNYLRGVEHLVYGVKIEE